MEQNKQVKRINTILQIVLMLLPVVMISTSLNNDIWFLLNGGRYITQGGGFTTIEPFTIHEGLNFIFQQWVIDVLFWVLYSKLGEWALLGFVYVCYFIFYFILYKLTLLISENNKLISVFTTFIICLLLSVAFFVTRPQTFTSVILILEIYLLESYVRKGKWQYLIALPILSVIQINCHCSYWVFIFVTMLPYLVDSFNIKIKGYGGEGYKKLPLFITFLIMIPVGLINPYGTSAMTYFFKSTTSSDVNSVVNEMEALNIFNGISISDAVILISLIVTLTIFICASVKNSEKFKLRYLLFILGYGLLSAMAFKSYMLFIVCAIFPIAFELKDVKIKIQSKKEHKTNKKLVAGLSVFIVIMLIALPFVIKSTNVEESKTDKVFYDSSDAIDYLAENVDDVNDVRLFVDYNSGGYSEFLGMKSYIDPRAEVFLKSFNDKEDIFNEYCRLIDDELDYKEFQEKYYFTHYFILKDRALYKELKNDDNYKMIYKNDSAAIFEVVNP